MLTLSLVCLQKSLLFKNARGPHICLSGSRINMIWDTYKQEGNGPMDQHANLSDFGEIRQFQDRDIYGTASMIHLMLKLKVTKF